ncbi:hypothetical protein Y047_5581 [Burkholderia pseudomallei MSHR3016]|nr:hypothetical protein Y047_5581 [Burkholderia pseudomallei MSHR3016]
MKLAPPQATLDNRRSSTEGENGQRGRRASASARSGAPARRRKGRENAVMPTNIAAFPAARNRRLSRGPERRAAQRAGKKNGGLGAAVHGAIGRMRARFPAPGRPGRAGQCSRCDERAGFARPRTAM